MLDERTFSVWLTLGPNGDSFQTQTGLLDRDALLSNNSLGAGYYTEVVHGKVQEALRKAINRVHHHVENGETLHSLIARDRILAFPGVARISDAAGGAHYPDQSIWVEPSTLVTLALSQNSRGNVVAPARTILLATIMTQIAAEELSDYIEATAVGARRIVSVLTVVDKAAKIAGVMLLVYGAATSLVRLMAAEAADTAASEAAAKLAQKANSPPYARYPTNYPAQAALEDTIDQAGITLDTEGGADAALNRYDVSFQKKLGDYNEYVRSELLARPTASLTDKMAIFSRADAKFGNIWAESG